MGKVVVMDHPLILHKIGMLRRKETSYKDFREIIGEIAALMFYEATRDFKLEDVKIETPICECTTKQLCEKKPVIVPILRAGLGMVNGILDIMPMANVGHIGLHRDASTFEAHEYYYKMPVDVASREVIVVDPMLATGGSAIAAFDLLKQNGIKNSRFICIIASPQGVEAFTTAHPDVDLYAGAVDEGLNDNAYIVPGLGDAGDRIFGTI